PLDRDVAELILALSEVVARTWHVRLDEDDVAAAEELRGRHDGRPAAPAHDRTQVGFRADAGDADRIAVTAQLAEHRGAVIAPEQLLAHGAADHAALVLSQILVIGA